MKKTIKTISLLLAVSLCLSLFGCDYINEWMGKNGEENIVDDSIKGACELKNDEELVVALIEYLQSLFVSYDMPDTSTAIKIDEIKNGKQALHVKFNKSEYYFVCAYYNTGHNYETIDYCCATNYTWVKFDDPKEVGEKYKDLSFVVAFQINKASFVADIITKDAVVPNIEHFQKYSPNFNNGLNTNDAITFDTNFIYLNSSNDKDVYHSMSAYNNEYITIPCIYLNERYYITKDLYTIYADGTRSDNNIISDFGKYYDTLVNIMDTTSYSVTDEKGRTTFYGLIEINAFSNCINE